ncbi:MAG: DNA-directed RNA polymerase subunit F [Nanoarchaeota archaeon]|nr:DNA-directed RNA polymerase subunit F [Nanoarchaeota archaeon]
MVEYEEIKETFVPISKVKEILEEVKEKTYEQKLAYEHAKKFSKLDAKKATALIKELSNLEMRKLKDDQIVKIADILPKDIDDLKVILAKSKIQFKEEELQKILEIVKKYEK